MEALKQASQKKLNAKPLKIQMSQRLREGVLILSFSMAVFLFISLSSYHIGDPGWSGTGVGNSVKNLGGRLGAYFADIFLSLLGFLAYVLPPLVVFAAWMGVREAQKFQLNEFIFKGCGFLFIILSSCGMLSLYLKKYSFASGMHSGGIFGDIIIYALTYVLNIVGSTLFLIALFFVGITLFTGFSWLGFIDNLGGKVIQQLQKIPDIFAKLKPKSKKFSLQKEVSKDKKTKKIEVISVKPIERIEPVLTIKPKPEKKSNIPVVPMEPGTVPPLTLLDPVQPASKKAFSNVSFDELSQLVEQRLADFNVETKVVAVLPGPVITRFELDLAPGIKVSKITGLAKDIARSMSVSSVRVVEVIPGKSVIGLELPNEHREIVGLRDILESDRYRQSRSPLSLALGKDIAGYPVVVDLAKMPHLLVAGTTGSGKSVSLNAMLLSMLFKATPEQLRMIMIDPKMLELSIYEGIPHLLTPVITDMKDASNALRWCVAEMDRRYRLMSMLGVRNLSGFNTKVTESLKLGKPIPTPEWLLALGNQPPELHPLPMIVVVADELADMMMVVGKKVEELVTRIAQKARAAGIHLILATQRPSVDVITGLIKANVPTRIAFQVSSRIDSRTILDQQGAEQLLGNGDMLYLPPGTAMPVRVHGAFVGDDEVHRVVAAWQSYGKPTYLEEITESVENNAGSDDNQGEADPLYDEALKIVTESRRASISLVQRRLRIGYNRAARIMEDMENAGVVSTMDGSGGREVLAPPPVES
jgi:S-DNA-T family DNA segregation ATPase FtsK/SpoIIIE